MFHRTIRRVRIHVADYYGPLAWFQVIGSAVALLTVAMLGFWIL